MAKHQAAHYFLEGLDELGIDYIFANLGTDHAPIIEEMARWQQEGRRYPQPVLCPHENVAIHMAGGYAMMTGKGQAVMVHVDVGTANTANGMHNLFRSRTPVFLMAGKAPYTIRGELPGTRDAYVHFVQEPYDMASIVRPYVKWEYNLPSGVVVKEALRRAHTVAHSDPKGPVYMTLQREVLAEEVEEGKVASFPAEGYGPTAAGGVDEDTVAELADRLLAARHPALITAYAGRNLATPALLDELAQLIGLRVYEFHPLFLNISRESPCYAGVPQEQDLAAIDFGLLVDVDVPWIPSLTKAGSGTFWAHVDVDTVKKDIPMWGFATHMRVQADSHKMLKRLLAALKTRVNADTAALAKRRMAEIAERRAPMRERVQAAAANKGSVGQISPAYLCAELNKVIGQDDIVVNESITNAANVAGQVRRTKAGTWIGLAGGGLGLGGGTALGAKLAKPDVNVFHFTGDGSFYFSNPAAVYSVAKQYGLPILTVILDNSGWSAVKQATLRVYPSGIASATDEHQSKLLARPQFEKIGEAFDAHGESVEDPAEVPAAIARCMEALKRGQAAVLVARVTKL